MSSWFAFRHDAPGVRFGNQHHRLQQRSRSAMIARAIAGGPLVLVGVILLFIPGPGLPVVLVGLALLTGPSTTLARLLDRAEPPLRHQAQLMRRGWHALGVGRKVGVVVLVLGGLFAIGFGAVHLIT